MAAGLATLELIDTPGFYESLGERGRQLTAGLASAARAAGIPLAVEHLGGMFGFVFTSDAPVRCFEQVAAADIERFKAFFHGMLDAGIYFAPVRLRSRFRVGGARRIRNRHDARRGSERLSKPVTKRYAADTSSSSLTISSRSIGSLLSRQRCFCSRSIGRISTNLDVTQPASSMWRSSVS